MVNYEKLGKVCKTYREKVLHLTQKEVAEKLNLSISSISMFENGNSRSTEIILFYIKLGLPAEYIYNCIEEG